MHELDRLPMRTRRLGIGRSVVLALCACLGFTLTVGQPMANATPTQSNDPAAPKSVIFLGDSVTAGFGYFGAKENAKNISGRVNDAFPSNWYFGDNSLSDCSPADGKTPIDQCSNNNFNGTPWLAGPWRDGDKAPTVAYSYQIAKSQDPNRAAPIENWAMTGSTPAQWDTGGPFNGQLTSITDTTAVMTLGANPILSTFLKIRLSGINQVNGACADSTMWLGWTGWWAYPPSYAERCADQQWSKNQQTEHLQNIYKTLLQNNNNVLVLGYYRACPWSFGVWQPNGNVSSGPASGNSCTSQVEKVSECSSCKVDGKTSQWEQAVAAQNAMNDKIAAAVASVQSWAQQRGMDPNRLQFVLPDQAQWAQHQAWDNDSWVFKNDTWIHPSRAGHTQLAKTVTARACSAWGQWCGDRPAWITTGDGSVGNPPTAPGELNAQSISGKQMPARLRNGEFANLPSLTQQRNPLVWRSQSPKLCQVRHGSDLRARKRDGSCRLTAYAAGTTKHEELRASYTVRVR